MSDLLTHLLAYLTPNPSPRLSSSSTEFELFRSRLYSLWQYSVRLVMISGGVGQAFRVNTTQHSISLATSSMEIQIDDFLLKVIACLSSVHQHTRWTTHHHHHSPSSTRWWTQMECVCLTHLQVSIWIKLVAVRWTIFHVPVVCTSSRQTVRGGHGSSSIGISHYYLQLEV